MCVCVYVSLRQINCGLAQRHTNSHVSTRNEGKGHFWQTKGSCKFSHSQMHTLSIRLQ